jgi:hypothetical protein
MDAARAGSPEPPANGDESTMTYSGNSGAMPRRFTQARAAVGEVLLVAMIGLSAMISARAEPQEKVTAFAHKYVPVYNDTSAISTLTIHAPSFRAMIETQANGLLGSTPHRLIGGIHQGATAVTVGAAAGQPVRFEYTPGGSIVLWVGGQSIVTGLLAAQARPMASLVGKGNNGLVSLTDRVTHSGKRGYKPQVAMSYLDTEDGYWLLWADAISENLFYRTNFGKGEFPDGLTIVDSHHPVTISSDGTLEVRSAEPWVAFWKCMGRERGRIIRYDEFGLVMKPRDQDDARAVETVRRVFKWTPVMRLAALSDPVAFQTFVQQLGEVRIAPVATPRLLIDE